jgi:hypothetical protein
VKADRLWRGEREEEEVEERVEADGEWFRPGRVESEVDVS